MSESAENPELRLLDCRQVARSVDAFAADELDAPSREAVRTHLCACRGCRALLRASLGAREALLDASQAAVAAGPEGSWSTVAEAAFFDRLARDVAERVRAERPRRARAARRSAWRAAAAAAVLFVCGWWGSTVVGGAAPHGSGVDADSSLLRVPPIARSTRQPAVAIEGTQPVSFVGVAGQAAAEKMLGIPLEPAAGAAGGAAEWPVQVIDLSRDGGLSAHASVSAPPRPTPIDQR